MTNYPLDSTERYALFLAYHGKCFMCSSPVRFTEMHVDHVIAETFVGRLPHQVTKLYPNFLVNSFYNLVPTHASCNLRKGNIIYEDSALISLLELVKAKVPVIEHEIARLREDANRQKVLAQLEVALDCGYITPDDISTLFALRDERVKQREPLVVTFGVTIDDDLFDQIATVGRFPDDDHVSYAQLCDWLEKDLVKRLEGKTALPFFYIEGSKRDGEILSVRLIFPTLGPSGISQVPTLGNTWWELLEVTDYFSCYGISYVHDQSHN